MRTRLQPLAKTRSPRHCEGDALHGFRPVRRVERPQRPARCPSPSRAGLTAAARRHRAGSWRNAATTATGSGDRSGVVDPLAGEEPTGDAATTGLADRQVRGNPLDPGHRVVVLHHRGPSLPRPAERLLREVMRVVDVNGQRVGHRHYITVVGCVQRVERRLGLGPPGGNGAVGHGVLPRRRLERWPQRVDFELAVAGAGREAKELWRVTVAVWPRREIARLAG
jgi:hypothetical protein